MIVKEIWTQRTRIAQECQNLKDEFIVGAATKIPLTFRAFAL